jgi:IS6 family transposase
MPGYRPAICLAGFCFLTDVIVLAVRWYLRSALSYRDVEELLAERGVQVDHVTVYRWVQRFTPLLAEAARPCRHTVGDRWQVDETYVKVPGQGRYQWPLLYRISTDRRHRRRVGQAAVRAALVVMLDVESQDTNELMATDDQQLVEAFPADRPYPALGDGIRVERPHGRADHLGPGQAPHVVEHRPGEGRGQGGLAVQAHISEGAGRKPPAASVANEPDRVSVGSVGAVTLRRAAVVTVTEMAPDRFPSPIG